MIERESLPDCLEITAWTEDGEIMGVRHKTLAVEACSFTGIHPDPAWSHHAAQFPDRPRLERLRQNPPGLVADIFVCGRAPGQGRCTGFLATLDADGPLRRAYVTN